MPSLSHCSSCLILSARDDALPYVCTVVFQSCTWHVELRNFALTHLSRHCVLQRPLLMELDWVVLAPGSFPTGQMRGVDRDAREVERTKKIGEKKAGQRVAGLGNVAWRKTLKEGFFPVKEGQVQAFHRRSKLRASLLSISARVTRRGFAWMFFPLFYRCVRFSSDAGGLHHWPLQGGPRGTHPPACTNGANKGI